MLDSSASGSRFEEWRSRFRSIFSPVDSFPRGNATGTLQTKEIGCGTNLMVIGSMKTIQRLGSARSSKGLGRLESDGRTDRRDHGSGSLLIMVPHADLVIIIISIRTGQDRTAQHSTTQHSTKEHNTTQHRQYSTAQHSTTARHGTTEHKIERCGKPRAEDRVRRTQHHHISTHGG